MRLVSSSSEAKLLFFNLIPWRGVGIYTCLHIPSKDNEHGGKNVTEALFYRKGTFSRIKKDRRSRSTEKEINSLFMVLCMTRQRKTAVAHCRNHNSWDKIYVTIEGKGCRKHSFARRFLTENRLGVFSA